MMHIGSRHIGDGHSVYIIAELGVNHDGSVDRALELTRAAHAAGADAIKLQFFQTDRLMSRSAKLAVYQKAAGEADPIAMLRRLELSIEQMAPIVALAHDLGIHAIVTVFSTELVDRAESLPWDAYKAASPDIVHQPLLTCLAATGKPLIISTGASTLDEARRAAGWLAPAHDRLAVMQCVSSYPTPNPRAEIGGIRALADALPVPVGYSDHTSGNGTGGVAVAYGAAILEKHLTHDRRAKGPDHAASLTPSMMSKYVSYAHSMEGTWSLRSILTNPDARAAEAARLRTLPPGVERDRAQLDAMRAKILSTSRCISFEKRVLDIEQDVRAVSRQSLTTTRPLPAGHTLTIHDLTCKRPGAGLLPFQLPDLLGRTLAHALEADTQLVLSDLNADANHAGIANTAITENTVPSPPRPQGERPLPVAPRAQRASHRREAPPSHSAPLSSPPV